MASQIEALPQAPQQILPIPHAAISDIPDSPNKLLTIQNNFTGYGNVSVHWKRGEDPTASDPTVDLENGTEISVTGDIYVRALPGEGNTSMASPSAINKTNVLPANWVQTELPGNDGAFNLIYANNMFYAGGASGSCFLSSTDAVEWTKHILASTRNDKILIAYGNGKFVAIAWGTQLAYTSTDANEWESHDIQFILYSLAFSNGIFVAGGYQAGVVYTSSDGISWTLHENNTISIIFYRIKSVNDKFYAGNDDGYRYWSANGINWNEITGSNEYSFYDISYGQGKYIATFNKRDALYVSSNGIDFSYQAVAPFTDLNDREYTPQAICYSEEAQKWVIVAIYNTSYTDKVYSSLDGENWEYAASMRQSEGNFPYYLISDAGKFVLARPHNRYIEYCINS